MASRKINSNSKEFSVTVWKVNNEQYKKLVQEMAWAALRISGDTVYYLDAAGVVRVGTVDTVKLESGTNLYESLITSKIPIITANGKSIYLKWVTILASDKRTCKSTTMAECKAFCNRNGIEGFDFKSLAWNKAMSNLYDGLVLSKIIETINENIVKLDNKEKGVPFITGRLRMDECTRKNGRKGQPLEIDVAITLDKVYTREQLKPYIRKINTEMMNKLMRHWKFKGFENTMMQYRIDSMKLTREGVIEYRVSLKDEYRY